MLAEGFAKILPFQLQDQDTGRDLLVRLTPSYLVVTIDKREYFFIRETGEYDGYADTINTGPILISPYEAE